MYINFPLMFLLPADGGRNWIAADCCPLLWPVEIWQLRKNLEECQVAEHEEWVWPTALDILWLIAFGKKKTAALQVDLNINHAPTPAPIWFAL